MCGGVGGLSAIPDHLGPGGPEVQDPATQGDVQYLLNQLASQSGGNYTVESCTEINEQRSHIASLLAVMIRLSVQHLGDGRYVNCSGSIVKERQDKGVNH